MRRPDDGLVTGNERDSGVAVVHGCFSDGGDSILRVFSSEPLQGIMFTNCRTCRAVCRVAASCSCAAYCELGLSSFSG